MGKKILRSPITTVVLVVVAAGLLFGGVIGGVRAAPLITSDNYVANLELASVNVGLSENGTGVANGGELLTAIDHDDFHVGQVYDEVLTVTNTGAQADISEYVRVTVYRYWTDADGKAVDLDPSLIELHFLEGNGWTIDTESSTPERTVLYYSGILAPGDETAPFTDTLTISGAVNTAATRLANGTPELDYSNVTFHIEAVADAVQDHNADAAMTASWGRTN